MAYAQNSVVKTEQLDVSFHDLLLLAAKAQDIHEGSWQANNDTLCGGCYMISKFDAVDQALAGLKGTNNYKMQLHMWLMSLAWNSSNEVDDYAIAMGVRTRK